LIAQKVGLLSKNPYANCKSELLVGELKGLRSARVTKSFRFIFSICKECRARKLQQVIGCLPSICKELHDENIVFLTIGPHDEAYS